MRILSIVATIIVFISVTAPGIVSLNVYESDGITPFDGRNISIGTELKLVVTSDANDCWSGGLFLHSDNRDLAALSGGEPDPDSRDWPDCHFFDAGTDALVMHWEDSVIEGFDLFTGFNKCKPGRWFEIDYTALAPGDPNVGFYEYDISWEDPNECITFHQVPAADFNANGIVNLEDYFVLSSCWLEDDLTGENGCIKADLYPDGIVDLADLILFSNDWLWGAPEPNRPQSPVGIEMVPDPNLIFRIVDENGLNEITLDIGQTVTLYIDMLSFDENDVWAFMVETNLSDPNLGMIDNTAYDPNNPPGNGTARILAGPNRWALFDRWGPGYQQEEGIYLFGLSSGSGFENGYMGSFEYTCQQPGNIELSILSWDMTSTSGEKLCPTFQTMVIHQIQPAPLMMVSSETSFDTQTEPTQATPSLSPEEMAQALEDIWLTDEELKIGVSEEEWLEFIESVKTTSQTENIN